MIAIWKETKKLCNPHVQYNDADGTTHVRVPESLYEWIEPDAPPADYTPDTYTVREDWEATQRPYVIYERKSDEQIAELNMQKAKQARTEAVEKITITTAAGNTFDGDERSQDRMARAVAVMDDTDELPWVLADNSIVTVSRAEVREALRLAGLATAAEWVKPYVG